MNCRVCREWAGFMETVTDKIITLNTSPCRLLVKNKPSGWFSGNIWRKQTLSELKGPDSANFTHSETKLWQWQVCLCHYWWVTAQMKQRRSEHLRGPKQAPPTRPRPFWRSGRETAARTKNTGPCISHHFIGWQGWRLRRYVGISWSSSSHAMLAVPVVAERSIQGWLTGVWDWAFVKCPSRNLHFKSPVTAAHPVRSAWSTWRDTTLSTHMGNVTRAVLERQPGLLCAVTDSHCCASHKAARRRFPCWSISRHTHLLGDFSSDNIDLGALGSPFT